MTALWPRQRLVAEAKGYRGGVRHGGRSRGGTGTNSRAPVDARGLPVRLGLTPGQAHDNTLVEDQLAVLAPNSMVLADRGFDVDHICRTVADQGAFGNIPPRAERKDSVRFSPRFTRRGKRGANFLATAELACVRLRSRAHGATTHGTIEAHERFAG